MTIQQLLDLTIARNASDLHILVGEMPSLRVNGELVAIQGTEKTSEPEIEGLIFPLLVPHQKNILTQNWELDLGLDFEGKARFRVNLYKQRGGLAAAFRLIPRQIRTLEQTGLPQVVSRIPELRQGFILVTGPTVMVSPRPLLLS